MERAGRRVLVAATSVATSLLLLGGPAAALAASSARIDHVESRRGLEHVLISITGLPPSVKPDLSTVKVTVDGLTVHATATPASQGTGRISRITVLAMDSSRSMSGARFLAAKAAALAFIAQAPPDVKIGLVSFASTVDTVQAPTADRAAVTAAVSRLKLSNQTHLYGGVLAALEAAGTTGQRRIVVLTDGRDTTGSPLSDVTDAVAKSGDLVDVVGLQVSKTDAASLASIANAGGGTLVNAQDSNALTALFSGEAKDLAGQVLVTFPVPPSKANTSANLVVRVDAADTTYSDNAFVSLGSADSGHAIAPTTPIPVASSTSSPGVPMLVAGFAAIGIAITVVFAFFFGVFRRDLKTKPVDSIDSYGPRGQPQAPAPAPVNVKGSALDLATKAIGSGGFEAKLSLKVDAAGLSLKPPEWVLLHVGIAMAGALVAFLLTSGNLIITLLVLLVGSALPWFYLGFMASKRRNAFTSQLPDALQLIAGGLTAGLSLAQSVDTIVREGTEPMAGEFRRALIEARLGVGIEDALEGVGARMQSADFDWVVMAVRIQREVGGNLAEVILNVSTTLREREFLRRQVRALSAEGRLSAWILCLMPPLFLAYLAATNPQNLRPLFNTAAGIGLLALAVVLMAVGSFWMSKMVKVEA